MMRPKLIGPQRRRTSLVVWLTAIVCAFLAVAVIITGLVIFVGYMIIRPKPPSISVTYSHLDSLKYDQYGQMSTEVALFIAAENDNAKAHASFSDLSIRLQFHGMTIAELRADPFDVPKNTTISLEYHVPSSMIPLVDEAAMEELDESLKRDLIKFHMNGKARTRWKVGILGSVSFWTHLDCDLKFTPSNGTSTGPSCSSKAH
ncbi:NDR1/HIN1-like protein 3 [Aristolochia californica]|uniref:NDR1/HIN1-like protein 3 n=1 Tax=Aristolochia californica TaxID=171875 RepID=UPI0035D8A681